MAKYAVGEVLMQEKNNQLFDALFQTACVAVFQEGLFLVPHGDPLNLQ